LRIYNRYVVSLILASCLINTLLAFLGQNNLSIYFIVSIISFLVITLLFTYFNPRTRKVLNSISVVFFAGFLIIVIIEVVDIISGI
jgi:hypothetical protein